MLKDINRIYKYCTSYKIRVHEVYDQQMNQFSIALKKFQAMLYASEQIETWKNFTGSLKRYRYLISVSPLPPDDSVFAPSSILKNLSGFLKLQQSGSDGSGQIIVAARNLLNLFEALSSESINKLYDRTRSLTDKDYPSDLTIVLLEHSLVKPVKDYFNKELPHNSFEVISIHELKRITTFKKVILFGAPAWLENKGYSFLFSAPRSSTLDLISYSWVKNTVKNESAFDCAESDSKILNEEKSKIEFERDNHAEIQESEDAYLSLPVPDISDLKKRLIQSTWTPDDDDIEESVHARIVILAGNNAVFVEAEKDSKSFVLNLNDEEYNTNINGQDVEEAAEDEDDDESGNMLGRYSNEDLQEGMFLLLRTGGGGDFIVPVADKILGSRKTACREMQKYWKDQLKSKMRQHGIVEVQKMIIRSGGTKVHVVTIKNWANERNIRPGTSQNFKALLHILGLGNEFNKYNENVEIILTAHRKAGRYIRRLLLEQIKKADMKTLIEEGVMRFNLLDIDTSASMTAYRIERILEEIHEIPYYKLGHPVDIGAESWQ